LLDITSKLYKIQGSNIIKAITKGNNIVQQSDISWSYRILGKEALAQIKINIIIQDFNPRVRPYIIPSFIGSANRLSSLVSIIIGLAYI